jgi:hypothetical protein
MYSINELKGMFQAMLYTIYTSAAGSRPVMATGGRALSLLLKKHNLITDCHNRIVERCTEMILTED